MAMRRRRFFRRTRAGTRGGRSYYWFRYTPFNLSMQESATATHSDILLTESDWANPSSEPNQTRRGGPRLERLILDFGISLQGTTNFWAAGGAANIALIPEFIIWKQSDQFVSIVTSSVTFDQTRESNRIIMDEVPAGQREFTAIDPTSAGGALLRTVQGRFETKSKVRLAEGALGIAWRGLFNTASPNLNGYTDWVRPTILISTP